MSCRNKILLQRSKKKKVKKAQRMSYGSRCQRGLKKLLALQMKNERRKQCGSCPAVREQVVTQACGHTLYSSKRFHMWSAFTGSEVDTVGGDTASAIKQIN